LYPFSLNRQVNNMKFRLIIALSLFVSSLQAQKIKIAYAYEDYVFRNLKETQVLQDSLTASQTRFQKQYEQKSQDYQTKYAAYQAAMKDVSNLTSEQLNTRLKEVQGLQQQIEAFQKQFEAEYQQKANTEITSIRSKIVKAMNDVAKVKGYTHVFRRNYDNSVGESNSILLYSNDNGKDDISNDVIIKLGSTPPTKK
jgi:outer membrane protein